MSDINKEVAALSKSPKHFGRMNDPTGAAVVKGLCGDEMEFYLTISEGVIEEAKFYTEGCISTVACGKIVAELAQGKSIDEALGVSPGEVKGMLKGLAQEDSHCSILAVSALYRAIADYLLKK